MFPFLKGFVTFGSFTEMGKRQIVFSSGEIFEFENMENLNSIDCFEESLGVSLKSIDIDGDGIDEIIGAQVWYEISAYSAVDKSKFWTHETELNIDALTIADVDQDGLEDVVYADAQWGSMHALSVTNGSEFWKMDLVTHGAIFILFDDFDNDGDLEVGYSDGCCEDYSFFIYNVFKQD